MPQNAIILEKISVQFRHSYGGFATYHILTLRSEALGKLREAAKQVTAGKNYPAGYEAIQGGIAFRVEIADQDLVKLDAQVVADFTHLM